jgi:hypothetical protein
LIAIRLRAAIADWRGDGGLKALLQRFEAETAEVSVPDECILHDMDRPDDHRRMCARLATRHILSPTECQSLLTERLNVSPAVKAHGRAVAEMAVRIGEALNRAGSSLDLELIRAAALVHDMARGKPGHARRAAELLRELDMPAMAEIVESHMDLSVREDEPIREVEVVFLADKLIRGERFVGLEARYLARLEELSADPLAQAAVRLKLESARRSAARVESVIGRSVASLKCDTGANSPPDKLRDAKPLSSPPRSPEIEQSL